MQNDISLYNFEQKQINSKDKNEKDYVLIEINKKIYALETKDVLEIIKVPELDRPSNMPESILGFFEYKQNHIPVVDLRQIFEENRTVYDLSAKILLLKSEDTQISIICDRVNDILKLNKDKIHPIPYQGQKEFFKGIYIDNKNNPYILDINNLAKYVNINSQYKTSNKTSYIIDTEEAKAVLKERKDFLKQIKGTLPKTTPIFDMGVSFVIDNIKYYINLASVREFFKPNNAKIIKVPSVPDFIVGLINIKGEYITILDIRKFYDNIQTTVKEKSTIIILNSQEFKIGILADEILEGMNINFNEIVQNKLQKQEEDRLSEYVKDNEIYQILDIEKLFQDERLTIC